MATEDSKKGCKKKRTKKDAALAAIRTTANKRRNLATQARRQEMKKKKVYIWALRQGALVGSHLSCRAMRDVVRQKRQS